MAERRQPEALLEALVELARSAGAPVDDVEEVIDRLRRFRETWARATDEARAVLVGRIYARIVVAGGRFVRAELTDDAKRWGLALAMPETVELARPARAGRSRPTVERIRIPIEGRTTWLRAARSA